MINSKNPKVSIVTATFNAEAVLNDAAASIRDQSYRNLEWIIADGLSKDDTLGIVERNLDIVTHCISEPDSGIYDAWNNALKLISGEWVIFLGADDRLADTDTISEAVKALAKNDGNLLVYGQVRYYSSEGRTYLYGAPWSELRRDFNSYMTLPHQGVFHNRQLFELIGEFDIHYQIAGDYDLLLRAVTAGVEPQYIPIIITNMGGHGVSSVPANAVRSLTEYALARNRLGITPGRTLLWYSAYIRATVKVVLARWFGIAFLRKMIRIWAWFKRRKYPK